MRVLIDTNIILYREDNKAIPRALQKLLNQLSKDKIQVLVHPLSYEDIKGDKTEERKMILSKIPYSLLKLPPNPDEDYPFRLILKWTGKKGDIINDNLLYCVYRDAVDFLITDDNGIHEKGAKIDITDRVLSIDEALKYFSKQFPEISTASPSLERVSLNSLNLDDPFFDELKEDYDNFEEWFGISVREGKEAWVFMEENNLRAMLLLEIVDEAIIDSDLRLDAKKRLKIQVLRVSHGGYIIGELFIKIAVEYAVKGNIDQIYINHLIKENDFTIKMIEDFGFSLVVRRSNGVGIFLKELKPPDNSIDPVEISKIYHPSFYDGMNVKKFIIPIRLHYHNLLFQDSLTEEKTLFDNYIFITEGNTIKKAYICNSRIKKIKPGDILLFYLSQAERSLTTVGVVEEVYWNVNRPDRIMRYVGKRTVYERWEIEKLAKRKALVLLFRWHFYLKNYLRYDDLIRHGILSRAPRSIIEIPHEKYLLIKEKGGIDEDYTVG